MDSSNGLGERRITAPSDRALSRCWCPLALGRRRPPCTIRLPIIEANPKTSSILKDYLGSFCKKQLLEPPLSRSDPMVLLVIKKRPPSTSRNGATAARTADEYGEKTMCESI